MQPLVEQPADCRVGERADVLHAHHARVEKGAVVLADHARVAHWAPPELERFGGQHRGVRVHHKHVGACHEEPSEREQLGSQDPSEAAARLSALHGVRAWHLDVRAQVGCVTHEQWNVEHTQPRNLAA